MDSRSRLGKKLKRKLAQRVEMGDDQLPCLGRVPGELFGLEIAQAAWTYSNSWIRLALRWAGEKPMMAPSAGDEVDRLHGSS